MKLLVIIACLMAVVGCTTPNVPDTGQIERIYITCPDLQVDEPAWASSTITKGEDLEMKVRKLVAEIVQHRGYEERLKNAIKACK